jgi:hypothetical protein
MTFPPYSCIGGIIKKIDLRENVFDVYSGDIGFESPYRYQLF